MVNQAQPSFSWDNFVKQNTGQKSQPHPNQNLPQPEGDAPQDQDPKSFSWGQFQTNSSYAASLDPQEEESSMQWLTRNIVSNAARAGEQVIGAAGNLYKAAQDLAYKAPASTGPIGKAIYEWIGDDKWKKIIYGDESESLIVRPPTSNEIQDVTEGLTGEYTKPKTKNEAKAQRLFADIGSTLLTRRPASARNIAINNFGIPTAANAVQSAVEGLGFGEDKATAAKLGTWMALSLSGNVNGRQEAARMVNEGRNGLPDYLRADVPRYSQRMNTLERSMLHNDPRSQLARDQINGIRNDISNGQLSAQELMNRYDAINAAKNSRGLFELGHAERNAARRNIDRVLHTVRDEIMETGANHPEALGQWRNGMQAYAVIHQSQRMTRWIDQAIKSPYAKAVGPIAGALFGVGAYHHPAIAAAGSLGLASTYKGGQVAYRVWNDPNLANYYWRAVSAAAAENSNAFISNMKKLEDSYESKAKKNGWESLVPQNSKDNKKNKT